DLAGRSPKALTASGRHTALLSLAPRPRHYFWRRPVRPPHAVHILEAIPNVGFSASTSKQPEAVNGGSVPRRTVGFGDQGADQYASIPFRSVRRANGRYQHRVCTVSVGKDALEVGELRRVVEDDVGIGRISLHEVLVIGLRRKKGAVRLGLGDD